MIEDLQSQMGHPHLIDIGKGQYDGDLRGGGIFLYGIDLIAQVTTWPFDMGKPCLINYGHDAYPQKVGRNLDLNTIDQENSMHSRNKPYH